MAQSDDGGDGPDILQLALTLDQLDRDLFRSVLLYTPNGARGTFGGQLVAHALIAAARTVDDGKVVHSLHSNFLSAGDSKQHMFYRVRRARDGKAFATRTVTAFQNGAAVYVANVSFHIREQPGISHQPAAIPAAAKSPSAAISERDLLANFVRIAPKGSQISENLKRKMAKQASVTIRYNALPPQPTDEAVKHPSPEQQTGYSWIRANVDDAADVHLHRAIAFFVSDFTLALAPVFPHGLPNPNLAMMVSLDHTVFFHEDFKVNEWFLYETRSSWAGGNRGLSHGRIFSHDGRLVMSVVQEVLIRMSKGYRSIAKL